MRHSHAAELPRDRSAVSARFRAGLALGLSLPCMALAQPGGQQGSGAQGFEGYISEDALQVLYVRDMDVGDLGRNEMRAGFFLNEDRDLIGIIDMLVDIGEPNRRPNWSLQVGPRAYGALLTNEVQDVSIENQDVFSIAVGGTLSYFLGRDRATSVSASVFYAPDITTFGNADDVKDLTLRFETRLTESTRIFVGFRSLEFDLPVDREVDDGAHLGIRYIF